MMFGHGMRPEQGQRKHSSASRPRELLSAPDARRPPEIAIRRRNATESPPPPARIRYNIRLLRFPASRRGRGPLRPSRRLKA
ncbi:hypothetical protein I35_2229 [Burkholderia cenocepacia H111]|nr:hypothetical protein I35_2229 [Burkholderia cenocepacia H111]